MQDLGSYGSKVDDDIDLAELVLALVAPYHEGVCLERYANHLNKIKIEVGERYHELIAASAYDDVGVRLAALKHVLSDIYDYSIDDLDHEILESADMMRVIDRGKGLRSAICVLYMIAARSQGWFIEGLDFPNMFLCRIELYGVRVIFDPARQCRHL